MPGWPRILWDFEGGLDDAHLQNLKIAREFPKCEMILFLRDRWWPADFFPDDLIMIFFAPPMRLFWTPNPENIIINTFLDNLFPPPLHRRRIENAATTSVFKADRKIFEAHVRWSFNSSRSTERDFLQSAAALCLSLLSRRSDYSLPRTHQTLACVSACSCVWSIPTLFLLLFE